ncbi:MAG: quinolinate synthase NadA [Planctomycetota bacterium]|nr:quinolinate synthase NadA [Planctomycetota bacterium]
MLWQPRLPDEYLALDPVDLAARIEARRSALGDRLLILGHHYQQDDVIRHADLTGDSLRLSRMAAEEAARRGTEAIVFCGVHFMAETADILTPPSVKVMLPDLSAGCSMADMAQWDEVNDCWDELTRILDGERIVPITYVNSSAAVKAFVGMHGGACCTSSNAGAVFDWARAGGERPEDGPARILFLPDQHLGRNTAHARGLRTEVDAARDRGAAPAATALWDPKRDGGQDDEVYRSAEVILWAGHCSVHRLFRPEHAATARRDDPDCTVIVHPECTQEVVDVADVAGSTEYIIEAIESAAPGSTWYVGTEVHLVDRLSRAAASRGVKVRMLSDCQCLCTTMYRIDPPHLLWCLDNLAEGSVVNRIEVHPEAAEHARSALDRMLANVPASPVAVKG